MKRRMFLSAATATLAAPKVFATIDTTQEVVVTGHAYQVNGEDDATARRRALVDALVNAALSGGTLLRGYSTVDQGRMQSDVTLLRPAGRVLSHRIVSEELSAGLWSVTIAARVAPIEGTACGNGRRLVVTAYSPELFVSVDAPAWTMATARALANDVVAFLHRDRSVNLRRVIDAPAQPHVQTQFDYASIASPRAEIEAGDHVITSSITVEERLGRITLVLDIGVVEPSGSFMDFRVEREARSPRQNASGILLGRTRTGAEADLLDGVLEEVEGFFTQLTCAPPTALMTWNGSSLGVQIGRQHGLLRGSLAVINDPEESFGVLEIIDLNRSSALLRPLDPTRHPEELDGREVYFLEAGL